MKRYLLLILILPILAGCNSFLDQLPDDRTVIDTPEKMKELMVSAYDISLPIAFNEFMSDNVEDFGSGSTIYPLRQEQAYNWKVVEEETQDTPTSYWGMTYRGIAATNIAIETIDELGNKPEYDPYLGEAKVLRAYYHFQLVNLFAEHYNPATAAATLGVPYVEKVEKQSLVEYERHTVEEVYDKIEKDLVEGLPLITNKAYDAPKFHFNYAAAQAFAARYYLFRGKSEEDWRKVVEYTTNVLGAGTGFAGMLRDYRTTYTNLRSNISAFGLRYCSSDEPANLMLINASSIWYRWTWTSRYGLSNAIANDIYRNSPVTGTWMYADFAATPNYYRNKYYEFFRYAYPGATSGLPFNVMVAFSSEEVVFNRAEAYVMLKNYDAALEDLNAFLRARISNHTDTLTLEKVKKYYGETRATAFEDLQPHYALDEDQQRMLQCITDFRRKEFCQEGMRWWDIKRFHLPVVHKQYGTIATIRLERNDLRRVHQIPADALSYGMVPNERP